MLEGKKPATLWNTKILFYRKCTQCNLGGCLTFASGKLYFQTVRLSYNYISLKQSPNIYVISKINDMTQVQSGWKFWNFMSSTESIELDSNSKNPYQYQEPTQLRTFDLVCRKKLQVHLPCFLSCKINLPVPDKTA